jgi:hypothetical protein
MLFRTINGVFLWERHKRWVHCVVKVKVPRNRPEGPEEEGRGIALLFPDLGARRGWLASTTPRPIYPRERPGTQCTGGWVGSRTCEKNLVPIGIRFPDRPARKQSLYRLSYSDATLCGQSENLRNVTACGMDLEYWGWNAYCLLLGWT